jgi:hypothetical protein
MWWENDQATAMRNFGETLLCLSAAGKSVGSKLSQAAFPAVINREDRIIKP